MEKIMPNKNNIFGTSENEDFGRHWLHVPLDWRRPGEPESFDIYWRDELDFGQIMPRPSEEDISKYYQVDSYYTHTTCATQSVDAANIWWRMLMHLSWRFDRGVEPNASWWQATLGPKQLNILEIGCGNGSNLKIFRSLGHSVEGIEPDPAARRKARESDLIVHEGTAESIPVSCQKRKFDVIVFMHVLEHCLDPEVAINNSKKILNNGGTVVIEVPNNLCRGVNHFGNYWFWLDVPRHLNFFTERSLESLMESQGLKFVEKYYRGYCRQFNQNWVENQNKIKRYFCINGANDSWWSYFLYFSKTFLSNRWSKYDSVRIIFRYKS